MNRDETAVQTVRHHIDLLNGAVQRAQAADATVAAAGGEAQAPDLGRWRDLAWDRVVDAEGELLEAVITAGMRGADIRSGPERNRPHPNSGIVVGDELLVAVDAWAEAWGNVPPEKPRDAPNRMFLARIPLVRISGAGRPARRRHRRRKGGA